MRTSFSQILTTDNELEGVHGCDVCHYDRLVVLIIRISSDSMIETLVEVIAKTLQSQNIGFSLTFSWC